MPRSEQEQNISENGTAIQVGGDITINTGPSYLEVKEIALDVFNANFLRLSEVARETVEARVEEITDIFVRKLAKENPAGLGQSKDPDFQYALFEVQRQYARTGDKDLGDLLVDLLVDRSKQENRDIIQIVLTESLSTAPKLTEKQLAKLSIVFIFGNAKYHSVGSDVQLGEYFDSHVLPFLSKLDKNHTDFSHLSYCGCGSINLTAKNFLENRLLSHYTGLFTKGFEKEKIIDRGISTSPSHEIFIPCVNNASLIQVNAMSKVALDSQIESLKIPFSDREKINGLFLENRMSDIEIKEKCISIRSYMEDFFNIWNDSAMSHFSLTSVGIAIGHANIKSLISEISDLSIWIN
jgi:hypothetical protein